MNRLLQQKVNKMKSILQLNNSLMNSIVEEEEFCNDRSFSQNVLLTSTIDNNINRNFIKKLNFKEWYRIIYYFRNDNRFCEKVQNKGKG